jgi:hypothetical protein
MKVFQREKWLGRDEKRTREAYLRKWATLIAERPLRDATAKTAENSYLPCTQDLKGGKV